MLFTQRRICLYNFLNRSPVFKHLQNQVNHDSGALESGLSVADFTVRNNVFADFGSHKTDDGIAIFKAIGNDANPNYSIIPLSEFKQICPSLDCNAADYITTKKKIKDIKEGDYALSLDEISGKLKPAKVNALLDHGTKPIIELRTESGKSINTTKNINGESKQ